jgi:TolA-binding protein
MPEASAEDAGFLPKRGRISRFVVLLAVVIWIPLTLSGCVVPGSFRVFDSNPPKDELVELPPEDASRGLFDDASRSMKKYFGIDRADREGAKKLYVQAETTFKRAASLPQSDPERRKQFKQAASLYSKAAKKWPESALEQDAWFMAGESNFFADDLNDAEEFYSQLVKNHPRNRHIDRVQARKFQIGTFWVNMGKLKHYSILHPNFFDDSLPWTDVRGNGIRVYDQMRFDDPTGKIADDATMAGAVEHFERGEYEKADQWFTDLIQTFPDSEHQFKAHLLALRSKLNTYQGPLYTPQMLDEAQTLAKKMGRTFRVQLQAEPELEKLVAEADAEIRLRYAERLLVQGEYHRKRGENAAANWCYEKLVARYGDTPYTKYAQEGIAKTKGLEPLPEQRLAWLAQMFPDRQKQEPLVISQPDVLKR